MPITTRSNQEKPSPIQGFREPKVNTVDKNTTDYETLRLANIQRNHAVLAEIGLPVNIVAAATPPLDPNHLAPRKPAKRRSTKPSRKIKVRSTIRRVSKRLRKTTTSNVNDNNVESDNNSILHELELQDQLLTCEEYWKKQGKQVLVKSNGKYTGWVNEDLRVKLGIAPDPTIAWESNGGGQYSFNQPTGLKAKSNCNSAKEIARTMLRKNPNCYFYRHCAPGLDQHMGDWTEYEHNLFIETAKRFGCGNKWGLFSTHIPHRVGYQCSQYYRNVMLREGIISDPAWRMAHDGTPHFNKK